MSIAFCLVRRERYDDRKTQYLRPRQAGLLDALGRGGHGGGPGTRQAFRDVVNVLKVRGLIGVGDNAAIAKALRELEGELAANRLDAPGGAPGCPARLRRKAVELAFGSNS
jgi:hypothetical protein